MSLARSVRHVVMSLALLPWATTIVQAQVREVRRARIELQRDSLRLDSARRAALALTAAQRDGRLAQARMPSLVDSTEEAARRVLARFKLVPAITVQATPDPARDGRVLSQRPRAGAALPAAEDTVQLVVQRHVPARLVEVPDVTRASLPDAVQRLEARRLNARFSALSRVSSAFATVVAQSPAGGTRVPAGDTIDLTVEVRSVVPWIVGEEVSVATRMLAARGLRLEVAGEEYDAIVPAGRIARQRPDSGTPAPIRSVVTVRVSLGTPPPVATQTMPRLLDRTLGDALIAIRPLELTVGHVDTMIDAARAGRVVRQAPEAGRAVSAGDRVDVTVAVAAPTQRRVPAVVGLTFDAAIRALDDSGFVAAARLAPAPGENAGVVLAQEVPPGTERPARSVIGLTVSDSAAPTVATSFTMPDVVGLPRDSAIERLGVLSPVIEIVDSLTSNAGENDRVLATTPEPGAIVLPPVDVVLRVARLQPPAAQTAQTTGDSVASRPEPTRFPWLLVLGGAAMLGVVALFLKGRTKPPPGNGPEPPPGHGPDPSPPVVVTLRPSVGDLPVVAVSPNESLVAAEVTLVDAPSEVTLEHPGPLVATEETSHG